MGTTRTDDGVSISYRTRGEGGLNLLFMHGWAGSGAYFDETLKAMDLSGLRAVTVDLRGHGKSGRPTTSLTLDRLGRDVWAVADDLQADRVVVVGFSMSAKFAQYVALLHPQRVAGVVLVAGCPASEIPFPSELQRDWVGRAGDRERLKEVTRSFLTRSVAEEVLDRWAEDAATVPQQILDETLTLCLRHSFADRLAELRAPTLVVGGRHDPIFTPEALRHGVVAPLPRARLVLIDCNHEVPIEAPTEMALALESFVAGIG